MGYNRNSFDLCRGTSGTSIVAQKIECLTMGLKWKILWEYNLSDVCEQGSPVGACMLGTKVVVRRLLVK